ncbi:3-keto-5-aminohexanoate cleavage protein [Paremcibacter congregatus]|uniref:3-keto-5-aminohexanoate cleavage protein n=1 Tax=Paremcibacter congregatus TaxID=2043170 RepID=UPI003A95C38A
MSEKQLDPPGKMMVMVAPNGARKTKNDHAALPISPEELGLCAQDILDAGASVLHLHVRDGEGRHSLDPDLYRAAISAIREQVGRKLILQCTSEAVGRYSADEQMNMVRQLRPEAVSLALKEICPSDDDIRKASAFFHWCRAENIWPQYILYSPEEVARFEVLRKKGVFGEDNPSVLFVLGRYDANLTGDPNMLDQFLAEVDVAQIPWSVCCFGKTEGLTMAKVAEKGGHARVGFENNLHLANGSIASGNHALVAQLIPHIKSSNRTLATADDIREMFFS